MEEREIKTVGDLRLALEGIEDATTILVSAPKTKKPMWWDVTKVEHYRGEIVLIHIGEEDL